MVHTEGCYNDSYSYNKNKPLTFAFNDRDVQAIIFVLDSSDKLRLPVAKDELDHLLQHAGAGVKSSRNAQAEY